MLCLKIAGWVTNSVDPDEVSHPVASHLRLHGLLRPVCPNTYSKYGTQQKHLNEPLLLNNHNTVFIEKSEK